MNQNLIDRLNFLEESKHSHYNIVTIISGPDLTVFSLYAMMILKRSMSLVHGFTSLIRDGNLISAVPLIRLQLDNLLRLHAAFLVDEQADFIMRVIGGTSIRSIRDRENQRMTDAYLQRKLTDTHPWINGVYERVSGYIHLSEAHFANSVRASGERTIEVYIGPKDPFVHEDAYSDAVETMVQATHALLTYFAELLAYDLRG